MKFFVGGRCPHLPRLRSSEASKAPFDKLITGRAFDLLDYPIVLNSHSKAVGHPSTRVFILEYILDNEEDYDCNNQQRRVVKNWPENLVEEFIDSFVAFL